MRLEGGGCSKIVELIRQVGYNVEITFELATVTKAPPDLKIKIDNMGVELTKKEIIVAEHLTEHKRNIDLESNNVSIPMSTEGYYSHTHETYSIDIKNAEITFNDELKVDDKVIVVGINNGQSYIIIDRAVIY